MHENKDLARLPRLAAILTLLQSKRLLTAAEIAERFEISKRTAYRDIKALEATGVPILTEEGKGYSLLEGYTLAPVMFTEEEANALITGAKLISRNKDQSLVEQHQNAITKVKAVLRYSGKDKAELLSQRVAFFKNLEQEKTSNSIAAIQVAITNFRVLDIAYFSLSKEEKTQRQIEPQALYHTQENWILIAWCRKRAAYREFRLDRMEEMKVLEECFEPRKFDLMNYFKTAY